MDEITKIEQSVDKAPFESKKFWSLLVGMIGIFLILLASRFLKTDGTLLVHAMDSVIMLVATYMLGQGATDAIKAFKG